ncbi:MAG: zf-HC2 domain-containing protein, partial [Acidobacteria bacterium]|nr:zf-HC2 domain-containing protein [Acidobacteriota bacterium]
GRVLRVLDSYLSNELTVESNHEILEHLERCSACREELAARERLRRSVRRLAALEPGPAEGLEERLRRRLRETPVSRGRVRLPIVLLAAAALLATGIGISRFRTSRPAISPGVAFAARADVVVAVATQLKCTLSHHWAGPTPSREELVERAGPEYESALLEMTRALPGFRVVEAHRCGSAGSVLHFVLRSEEDETPHGLVSVLVTKDGGQFPAGTLATGETLRTATGEVVEVASGVASGFHVLAARHSGQTLAIVASASVRPEDRTSMLRAFVPAWVQAG